MLFFKLYYQHIKAKALTFDSARVTIPTSADICFCLGRPSLLDCAVRDNNCLDNLCLDYSWYCLNEKNKRTLDCFLDTVGPIGRYIDGSLLVPLPGTSQIVLFIVFKSGFCNF